MMQVWLCTGDGLEPMILTPFGWLTQKEMDSLRANEPERVDYPNEEQEAPEREDV